MPPESLTVAVTSGFGIGIIAGIVSGVCYILVHGFSGNRPRNNKNQWHCTVCGERFRSIGGVLDLDKVITCVKCGGKVCRKKCSNQDQGYWICQTCLNPESWFKGILKALHPNSIINKSIVKMDPNRIDEVDEDLESIRTKQKEQVRDFIERLVEGMLGGGIDGASIGRLYSDKQYLPVLGQSPCSAHAGLKLLIQRVIQEAIGLPTLKKVAEHPGAPAEEINRTYEDLLATAIINKVIENYQDELPTSSANSVSSRRSNLSIPNNKEYFFGEETLDSKWRNCNSAAGDVDTTSVSSMEEWVHSSSSTCSTKYVDHKSLTIQQRVQEASSSDEENRSKDWQENWKLQKRQFAGTASPVPVPMLVPNPTNEAKVLIGDREADDTTDLSDAGSEYGDADGVEDNLLKSLIRHDKDENEIVSDGTTDDLDIMREKDRILEQFSSYQSDSIDGSIWESFNRKVNLTGSVEDTSLDSHIEQDSEYTEKYATLPKTIVKSSTPIKSVSDPYHVNSFNNNQSKSEEINGKEHEENNADGELGEKFKGSYSEREKQKWQNAVEMKNNPYTEENINRRLHQTSSAVTSLFGRDYYIKEAAKATGARNGKDVDNDDAISKKLEDSSNETSSNAFIFKAVPAIVEANGSYHADSESLIELGSAVSPTTHLEISSDSDLSIERTYNLTSGKVYEKIGNIHKEIIKRTSSPEGLKFTPTNTEIVDENHNSMTSDKKRLFLSSLTNSFESDGDVPTTPNNNEVICEKQVDSNIPKVPLKASDEKFVKKGLESVDYVHNNKTFSIQEVSMDFSTESEAKTSAESSLNSTPDAEIGDLNDKHLVKDRLGQFSKSYPNLAALPLKKSVAKLQSNLEDDDDKQKFGTKLQNGFEGDEKCDSHQQLSSSEVDSSVTDLRKKFAAVQGKDDSMQKQVHSLTARSIPPVIRKELQESECKEELHNYSLAGEEIITPQAAIPQETTVIKEKEKLPIFPNAKSRIKFFENLNR